MNWTELEALVPHAGQAYDWAACCNAIPRLVKLEATPQDPVHHAEGNVGIHTRMVLDALVEMDHWRRSVRTRQIIMFLAALLHDIAKPETTQVDALTGRISQPGHSARGSVDVRILLWRAGAPFELREEICGIVAKHQVPFFAFNSHRGESPDYIVRVLSWEVRVVDLACVARADMLGRRCADQASHLDDIDLFIELGADDLGACLLAEVLAEDKQPINVGICSLYLAIVAKRRGDPDKAVAHAARARKVYPQPWLLDRLTAEGL